MVTNLVLLSTGGALLLFGPDLAAGFLAASSAPPSDYLDTAAAAGISCGAAATTLLLVRGLVGQAVVQAYAAPACLVVGFAGMLLWGLSPAWPLAQAPGAPLGPLALTFSLVGGGLVALDRRRVFGLCLTLLPTGTLFAFSMAHVGSAQSGPVWSGLAPALRASLGLLGATTLLLVMLAELARRPREAHVASQSRRQQTQRLQVNRGATTADLPARQPSSLREAILATKSDWRSWPLPDTKALLRVPRNFLTEMRSRRAASVQRARVEREHES